jgi:hypothetical protein
MEIDQKLLKQYFLKLDEDPDTIPQRIKDYLKKKL